MHIALSVSGEYLWIQSELYARQTNEAQSTKSSTTVSRVKTNDPSMVKCTAKSLPLDNNKLFISQQPLINASTRWALFHMDKNYSGFELTKNLEMCGCLDKASLVLGQTSVHIFIFGEDIGQGQLRPIRGVDPLCRKHPIGTGPTDLGMRTAFDGATESNRVASHGRNIRRMFDNVWNH